MWQCEATAIHYRYFPSGFAILPDVLQENGYHVGFTGKGWGPGDYSYEALPYRRNPAGPVYNTIKHTDEFLEQAGTGISDVDYARTFAKFLSEKSDDQPFYFWYGPFEPHHPYDKKLLEPMDPSYLDSLYIPPTLPNDYQLNAYGQPNESAKLSKEHYAGMYEECHHAETHMLTMIDLLRETGQLNNTLIIAVGDNGTSVPRAKASLYDYGVRVPFLAMWKEKIQPGRQVDDFVCHSEIMPTVLEAADIPLPESVTTQSFLGSLLSQGNGRIDENRDHIITAMEMHDYPAKPRRMIRNDRFTYIRNFFKSPDIRLGEFNQTAYENCLENGTVYSPFYQYPGHPDSYNYAKKHFTYNQEELYDLETDPWQLNNLAVDPAHNQTRLRLKKQMEDELTLSGDPRYTGNLQVWERTNEWVDYWNRTERIPAGQSCFEPYVSYQEKYFALLNRWGNKNYLYEEHGVVKYASDISDLDVDAYLWSVEEYSNDEFYIVNKASKSIIHIERLLDFVECDKNLPTYWFSARWQKEEAGDGFVRLVNRWKPGGLTRKMHVEGQFGYAQCSEIYEGWRSAQWSFVPEEEFKRRICGQPEYVAIRNAWKRDNFLCDELGAVEYAKYVGSRERDAFLWSIVKYDDDQFYIVNKASKNVMHIEHLFDFVECDGMLPTEWWSARWRREECGDGLFRLTNVLKPRNKLHCERHVGYVEHLPEVSDHWQSAKWQFISETEFARILFCNRPVPGASAVVAMAR